MYSSGADLKVSPLGNPDEIKFIDYSSLDLKGADICTCGH